MVLYADNQIKALEIRKMETLWISTFIFLCAFVTEGSADCPNGYLRHDDSCYKFYVGIHAAWAEATMYCELFGSKLAIISSAREQNFVQGLLRSEFRKGISDGVWLDGTDALVEGEWIWMGTSQRIDNNSSYSNWAPGRPNDYGPSGEDCLAALHRYQYQWDDLKCNMPQNFLCEKR